MLTAGPGVTNGISAITTAHFNGSPVVVLAGRAPDYRWGSGSLQEIDHPLLLAPVTKRAWTEHQAGQVGAAVDEAFRLAATPHRGPVFLDFSLEALFGEAGSAAAAQAASGAAGAGDGARPPTAVRGRDRRPAGRAPAARCWCSAPMCGSAARRPPRVRPPRNCGCR